MSHTEGELKHVGIEGGWDGLECNGELLFKLVLNNTANATHAVLCWNSYDALLAACEYNQRLLTENIGQATHAIALNKAAITKCG